MSIVKTIRAVTTYLKSVHPRHKIENQPTSTTSTTATSIHQSNMSRIDNKIFIADPSKFIGESVNLQVLCLVKLEKQTKSIDEDVLKIEVDEHQQKYPVLQKESVSKVYFTIIVYVIGDHQHRQFCITIWNEAGLNMIERGKVYVVSNILVSKPRPLSLSQKQRQQATLPWLHVEGDLKIEEPLTDCTLHAFNQEFIDNPESFVGGNIPLMIVRSASSGSVYPFSRPKKNSDGMVEGTFYKGAVSIPGDNDTKKIYPFTSFVLPESWQGAFDTGSVYLVFNVSVSREWTRNDQTTSDDEDADKRYEFKVNKYTFVILWENGYCLESVDHEFALKYCRGGKYFTEFESESTSTDSSIRDGEDDDEKKGEDEKSPPVIKDDSAKPVIRKRTRNDNDRGADGKGSSSNGVNESDKSRVKRSKKRR
jgi:hypothetical protein